MTETIIRDLKWIEREYNDEKFALISDVIESAIDKHETDLSRVIWQVIRDFRNHAGPEMMPTIYDGKEVQVPRIAMWEAYHGSVSEILMAATTDETDIIAELGSGWGLYLFQLWLRGAPKDARYFGFEYTKNGRTATNRLGELDPKLRIKGVPYDFYQPDYSAAGSKGCHALVYTCTAIEQIPQLPVEAIAKTLELADKVTGIHLEPVGWQFRHHLQRKSLAGSSSAYAEKNDYNRNLWQVLEQLQTQGLIKIEESKPDLLGSGQTNCLSYLKWTKI